MARETYCDQGDGEEAYAVVHVIPTTTITYLCLQHFLLDKLNSVLDMPTDLLAAAGLAKIPPAETTTEGGPSDDSAARPPEGESFSIVGEGAAGPPPAETPAPDPDDRRGVDGVEPGDGDRPEPEHAGATAERTVADRDDPDGR